MGGLYCDVHTNNQIELKKKVYTTLSLMVGL